MLQEREQVASHLAVTFSQPPAMTIGWCQHHDRVQRVIQPSEVAAPRALGQAFAPTRQHDGAQQLSLNLWSEDRIARLDGVFAVTQLVRQTDLPQIGMPL